MYPAAVVTRRGAPRIEEAGFDPPDAAPVLSFSSNRAISLGIVAPVGSGRAP